MKFFVDTADVDAIRELNELGMVDGVTTNPSLILKAGRDIGEVTREICEMVSGPVSAEVVAEKADDMIREGRHLAKIADNIAVKVPLTWDGLKACRVLSDEGKMVNVTLCFSAAQAILAAKAGATFISPFIGRLDDIHLDGMDLIADILPPGVLNVVTGYGSTVGAAISGHPEVDKVAFTGSTVVGKQILQASIETMKRVTLELGGKSPNIIFADADLDKAVVAAVNGFTRNSGQVCSAGTRVFVQEGIHDEVAGRIVEIASGQKVGDPFDPETKLGPVISARQLDRVMSYVDAGNAEGAELRTGGDRVEGPGFFVRPTVFAGVTNGMKIAREEIFGPVVSLIPFKDEDDAIFKANDTSYGLAAAVWSRDISRAHKVARAMKAGRIWVNTFGETDPVMPFGGFKQSGLGREFGAESVLAYTESKSVQVRF